MFDRESMPQEEAGDEEEETMPERKEYITKQEFDLQFRQSEKIDLEGEEIEVASIVPENPVENEWVVIVGGWATRKTAYEDEMYALARSGRKVLFLNPDHGVASDEDDAEYFKDRSVARTIAMKAAAVRAVLEERGITNADIVGHSQGAQIAVAMGARHPELVRRIVLDNPAGMIGKDTRSKLSLRGAAQVIEEGARTPARVKKARSLEKEGMIQKGSWKPGRAYLRERVAQAKLMAEKPIFRNVTETAGIAATDVTPLLRDIKERNKESDRPIEVILLNAYSDRIIPEKRIKETLGYEEPAYDRETQTYQKPAEAHEKPFELVDRWAMYSPKGASHNAPYLELPGTLAHILGAGASKADNQEKEPE